MAGAASAREVLRRGDEVAHQPLLHVLLIGQQPHVVAQPQQPLEELSCLVLAAHQRQVVRQPVGVRQEDALTWGQAVCLPTCVQVRCAARLMSGAAMTGAAWGR